MPTLDARITRAQKQSARLLQVARHHVSRWFRPAIAAKRQHPKAPHPMPDPVMARRASAATDQARV